MKILFITPTFLPTIGGTEKVIHEISHRLIRLERYEVTIVTPWREKNDVKSEDWGDVQVHRVDFPRIRPYSIPLFLSFLRRVPEWKEYDLIHQFHIFPLGGVAVLAKRWLKIPLVTSCMGRDTYDPHIKTYKQFACYIAWVMNSSDIVTAPCRSVAEMAVKQGGKKKIEIIPHGVDINRFNPNIDGTRTRRRLGLADDDVMVLSVQRLAKKKGLEYLLKAATLIRARKPKFVIVGKGPERNRLELLAKHLDIEGDVIFTSFVPDEELPEYYAACDIFVLPSLYEHFGLVFAEAMACGKPIISTKVGAAPEVIGDGKAGLIVSPADPNALAWAISRLTTDKGLREQMGEMGRHKVEREYDWNLIVKRYVDLYEMVLRGDNAAGT